ncbi:MAG: hypothetical protein OEV01_13515 [Nitrospira sp.]|nr:hypothetical protein [Nitrospira sp.]MDH4303994.1 hypothetical protein [Nitrospira sp.]MDH5193423.1 hypothetical protein [Nitrospira sp.]
MSESKPTITPVNVRLNPSDSSAHPRAANYTDVGVAQGIAYLDFGFIEPALLRRSRRPQGCSNGSNRFGRASCFSGAMGGNALAQLQQQIQQVLLGLRESRKDRPKARE